VGHLDKKPRASERASVRVDARRRSTKISTTNKATILENKKKGGMFIPSCEGARRGSCFDGFPGATGTAPLYSMSHRPAILLYQITSSSNTMPREATRAGGITWCRRDRNHVRGAVRFSPETTVDLVTPWFSFCLYAGKKGCLFH